MHAKWNINIVVLVFERSFNVKGYGQTSLTFMFLNSTSFFHFFLLLFNRTSSSVNINFGTLRRGWSYSPDSKRTFALFWPEHCEKYRNFTWSPGVEILRKGTVSTPGNQVKLRYFSQWKVSMKVWRLLLREWPTRTPQILILLFRLFPLQWSKFIPRVFLLNFADLIRLKFRDGILKGVKVMLLAKNHSQFPMINSLNVKVAVI